ncbi:MULTISPECIES: globin domain-containing protein [unclassified Streptomyces]|uniref:globin domain-containing protein n=1 Tax=unclassified Streptomyces TaxID=2593676 RepID=UPI002E768C39|nr:globin domain-containing protein [Streptomyces sp. JV176]MEE1798592.1 FAD-binding oxidoreductase [Streptomyces sp. JV176]
MDAPTTTSADNGTSGDSGGSGERAGGGWFAPRRAPSGQGRPDPAAPGGAGEAAGRDRIPPQGRTFASIRPVGSGGTRTAPPPREGATAPDREPAVEQPAPVQPPEDDGVPDAFRPRAKAARADEGPAAHPQVSEGPGTTGGGVGGPVSAAAAEAAVRSAAARPGPVPPDSVDAVRHHPVQPEYERPPGAESADGPPAPAEQVTEWSGDGQPAEGAEGASLPPQAPVSAALPPEAPVAAQAAPAAPAAPAAQAAPAGQPSVVPPPPAAPDPNASPDAILVRRTLAEIAPVSDQVTSYFYSLLFVRHPDLRGLFPVAMDAQRDRLLKALLTAAEHMDSPAVLTDYLRQLGRGHRKYGTQSAHYPAVGEALMGALARYASASWDEDTEGAWVRTYTTISQIMIDAAAENEQHAPAWWQAEVVSHESRTSDIAVVTVRPDQPYPFLAGQYTSLETPWWPRVWRHYSFASAPRPDGLLSFHVKAVPAGWVSNALVHHARPGDILRLGPPAGSMTVDHSKDNGLLCLGGGTGIAPIKALIEDVAERGHRRPVEVFYGARSDHDLYDMETMLELESAHPWLSVRPVVAEGPTAGLTGRLPEAVRDHGPWHEFDAYLSGPPGMIRSSLDALRGSGIPSERIRHDSLDELVAAM